MFVLCFSFFKHLSLFIFSLPPHCGTPKSIFTKTQMKEVFGYPFSFARTPFVDGVLGLWRPSHMKCHVLVIEQACRDLAVRFDRHVAGTDNHLRLTPCHHPRPWTYHALQSHSSSCNGASVSLDEPLCLASLRNAQQGIGFVDHLLLPRPSVSLQGFLLEVVLVGRWLGPPRAQPPATITRGTGPGHFTICGWVSSTILSTICVRICGMRSAISSTCGLACSPAVSCHGLTTTMRDFDVSCRVPLGLIVCGGGVLWCVLCELPTASLTDQARVCCGYCPGPTRDTPPSRQDDGKRQSASSCVFVSCVLDCARGHISWWLDCGVVLSYIRTPPRTMLLASSSDLGRPSGQHVFVKSSNSFTFSLYDRS